METAVKERPIIFSGEMVRAILDGRKTQTRRVVKPQPDTTHNGEPYWHVGGLRWRPSGQLPIGNNPIACPYGKPGDRLWVRESFVQDECVCQSAPAAMRGRCNLCVGRGELIGYAADGDTAGRKRPSTHMPRWASRITLEVSEVRMERLQDISFPDCRAEGMDDTYRETVDGCREHGCDGEHYGEKYHFMRVWESINGTKHPWASNPWVWVVSFKRTED